MRQVFVKSRSRLASTAAGVLVLMGLGAFPVEATVVYSTDFNSITSASGGTTQGDGSIWGVSSFSTGSPAATWSRSLGNFDWVRDGNSGYRCVGNTGGCIELGGSSGFGAGGTTPPSQVDLTLNLAAGSYTMAFDFARQLYGPAGFDVRLGNSLLATIPQAPATAAGVWNSFSQGFTIASGGPVIISLYTPQLGNNVGAQLDNFSITRVPEPETYTVVLLGLALGCLARRRRTE